MSMLKSLGTVKVRSSMDRVSFEAAATYLVQVTKVEEFTTRKKVEATRLSFIVLEVEADPTGGALSPGQEPEIALYDDEWGRGVKSLLQFAMVSHGLTEKQTNSLTEADFDKWYETGAFEGIVLRLEIVAKAWQDKESGREATFYNPKFKAKIDKRKLSKTAKEHML